jgi:recombination protein RecR
MASLPETLQTLVAALNKLPGIGPRSAERLALHLVQADPAFVAHLSAILVQARETIQGCSVCGSLTDRQPCALCADARREQSLVCVVERSVDIISLEKSNTYRGGYHVLGGRLSPLNGVGPEDLRVAELEQRLTAGAIQEIILALPTDVEGDATSYYLAKRLARPNLKITRIAYGLPAGSGLEFADELTLSRALDGRRELT